MHRYSTLPLVGTKEPVVGVVYPLPGNIAERIFHADTTLLPKFIRHDVAPRGLHRGTKLVVYASRTTKKLIGEAVIESIECIEVAKVLSAYDSRMLLSAEEFRVYVGDRQGRSVCIFHLVHPRRYETPVDSPWPITMTGRYIRDHEYRKLPGPNPPSP